MRLWVARNGMSMSKHLAALSQFPRPGLPKSGQCFVRPASTARSTSAASDVVPLRKQLKKETRNRRLVGDRRELDASQFSNEQWQLTVGIEIHAQLNTTCKLFSDAETSFNASPNSNVEPLDVSLPGTQPHFQRQVLLPAVRAALALRCTVQETSRFDRKHYFYHDQPAGYQITQYYEPLAIDGEVTLTAADGVAEAHTVGIKQVQLEQDTAKSQGMEWSHLVDFNRAGHPLIEVISLPHIHSPSAASAYVKKVQGLLLSVNAVTAGMEQGGLRADVNVSVRHRDSTNAGCSYGAIYGLGQRTEIKNLGTIKAVEDAVRAEYLRQVTVLEAGGQVLGETRGWSITNPKTTRRLRGKEGEVDYRYLPDPDIAPLRISPEAINRLEETLPSSLDYLVQDLIGDSRYMLSPQDARILLHLDSGDRLDFYQETVDALYAYRDVHSGLGRLVGNWVLQETSHALTVRNMSWAEMPLTPQKLASLLEHLVRKHVTILSAKDILGRIIEGDRRSINRIVDEEGLRLTPLTSKEYVLLAQHVVNVHGDVVEQLRRKFQQGKLMYLVGQMLKIGPEGRIEAVVAEKSLREVLGLLFK